MTATATTFASAWLDEEQMDEIASEKSGGAYVQPSKLEENKSHRFRIFGRAITGFEGWVQEGKKSKPVRFFKKPTDDELPGNIKTNDSGKPDIKRFLACLVWDYQAEEFRILSMTQKKSLIDPLNNYARDPDYGDPQGFDIKITRSGSGLDTEYTLLPSPPKAVAKAITEKYADFYCDLTQLFEGEDPFKRPAD